MRRKTKIELAVIFLIVIVLFILVSYIVDSNIDFFKNIVQDNFYLGIFIFIILEVISIVVAPVTTIPILPIASKTYGVFLASCFFIIGGIIGSLIAFIIGKTFGKKVASRFVSIEQAEEAVKAFPKKHLFFSLIFLRTAVSSDVLSYSLGIFTKIGYKMFISTTVIGIIPSAIFFAYLGVLPTIYQIIGWVLGIVILLIILYFMFKRRR